MKSSSDCTAIPLGSLSSPRSFAKPSYKGRGEFHQYLKWRMENNDKIQIKFEEPRIPYRETITKVARATTATKSNRVAQDNLAKCT